MKKAQRSKQYFFICQGKDCLKRGAKIIQQELEQKIKNSGQKSSYQMIKTRCMDACKQGPILIKENICYQKVQPKDLDKIFRKKAVD